MAVIRSSEMDIIRHKTLRAVTLACLWTVMAAPAWGLTTTEASKLLASGSGSFDRFGISVALDDSTLVIGAPGAGIDRFGQPGAAYVFVRDESGRWNEQDKLTASDGAAGDAFGVSVSVKGDIAVIGAFHDDRNGFQSGSAYVFVRDSEGGWI
jgi:hypothetical protein